MEKEFFFELGQRLRDLGVWMVNEYKAMPEDTKPVEQKQTEIKVEPQKPAAVENLVLSRVEAAKYLGIHENTIDKSNIPRIRMGGRTLFRKVSLDRYLRERENEWKPGGGGAACGN